MAVFTEVSAAQAQELLSTLNLGELRVLRGIEGGIENTNYFATTSEGEFVLTLFERLTFEQLPFYLHLMKHLAQSGIPVPDPAANRDGGAVDIHARLEDGASLEAQATHRVPHAAHHRLGGVVGVLDAALRRLVFLRRQHLLQLGTYLCKVAVEEPSLRVAERSFQAAPPHVFHQHFLLRAGRGGVASAVEVADELGAALGEGAALVDLVGRRERERHCSTPHVFDIARASLAMNLASPSVVRCSVPTLCIPTR